jgi:hypothetical protein
MLTEELCIRFTYNKEVGEAEDVKEVGEAEARSEEREPSTNDKGEPYIIFEDNPDYDNTPTYFEHAAKEEKHTVLE